MADVFFDCVVFLCTIGLLFSSIQAQDSVSVLDQKVYSLLKEGTVEPIVNSLSHSDAAFGFVMLNSKVENETEKTFRVKGTTIREILNEITAHDPRVSWRLEGLVVVVYGAGASGTIADEFLSAKPRLDGVVLLSRSDAAKAIETSEQVRELTERTGFTINFYFKVSSWDDRRPQESVTLIDTRSLDVKGLLNAILVPKRKSNNTWSVVVNEETKSILVLL